jgi:carbon monoxide dehydrogenase subunit G
MNHETIGHARCPPNLHARIFHAMVLMVCAVLVLHLPEARADTGRLADITGEVRKQGDVVVVDFDYQVDATPQEAWAVLTDFDHMAAFLPNLKSSKVIGRTDDTLVVAQDGKATYGPVSFSFDNVREVHLTPYRSIRSHLLSGSLKKFDSLLELTAQGSSTHIHYHAESIADVWLPPLIGVSLVKRETQQQIQDVRSEILRRKRTAQPGTSEGASHRGFTIALAFMQTQGRTPVAGRRASSTKG